MSFWYGEPSQPTSVWYRFDQTTTPKPWYSRHVGWFGQFIMMVSLLSFFGFFWGMRQSLITSVNLQYAQAFPPQKETEAVAPVTDATARANAIVQLDGVLAQWSRSHPGQRWSVVAKSIEGPTFEAKLNADMVYQTASIYKLFLTYPLATKTPLAKQKTTYITVNGVKKSVAQCADLMIRLSDNPCGNAIGDYVGWGKADAQLKAAGYKRTDFIHQKNYLQTSAGDTAKFLENLNGSMIPAADRDAVLTSMSKQIFRKGIPTGCPGCQVSDKIGDIDNVLHDAAIVNYSKGKYILVIFSENSKSYTEIAKLTGQIHQEILDTAK